MLIIFLFDTYIKNRLKYMDKEDTRNSVKVLSVFTRLTKMVNIKHFRASLCGEETFELNHKATAA